MPSLDWAASRFELGAERSSLIEALSDYLLALRGLLEGGGPPAPRSRHGSRRSPASPYEREQGRVTVERALAIERKLMSGGRYKPVAGASPLDVIAEVEELLRRLLKGMATGELGGDLRVAADEILLSEGLSAMHVDSPRTPGDGRMADPGPESRRRARPLRDLRRPSGAPRSRYAGPRSRSTPKPKLRRRRTKSPICPSAGAGRIVSRRPGSSSMRSNYPT